MRAGAWGLVMSEESVTNLDRLDRSRSSHCLWTLCEQEWKIARNLSRLAVERQCTRGCYRSVGRCQEVGREEAESRVAGLLEGARGAKSTG